MSATSTLPTMVTRYAREVLEAREARWVRINFPRDAHAGILAALDREVAAR